MLHFIQHATVQYNTSLFRDRFTLQCDLCSKSQGDVLQTRVSVSLCHIFQGQIILVQSCFEGAMVGFGWYSNLSSLISPQFLEQGPIMVCSAVSHNPIISDVSSLGTRITVLYTCSSSTMSTLLPPGFLEAKVMHQCTVS